MAHAARRAPREGGFTLVEILIVVTIIAALIGIVSAVIPKAMEGKRKTECQNNLRNIVVFLNLRLNEGKLGVRGGTAMILNLYKKDVKEGDERLFICPGDPRQQDMSDRDFLKRYQNMNLDSVDATLCSYAGRNRKMYAIRFDSTKKQAWATDCQGDDGRTGHHLHGVNVGWEDGSVKFMDYEDLGLAADAAIAVGDTTHELLKQFCIREQ